MPAPSVRRAKINAKQKSKVEKRPVCTRKEMKKKVHKAKPCVAGRGQSAKHRLTSRYRREDLSIPVNAECSEERPFVNFRPFHTSSDRNAVPHAITSDLSAKHVPGVGSVSEGRSAKRTKEEHDCLICLDTSGHTIMKYLRCLHIFHEVCINRWMEENGMKTCPICRRYYIEKALGSYGYQYLPATQVLTLQKPI